MDKRQFPRKFKVYLPLLLLAAASVLLMPQTPKFGYDYKKGEPWQYETLIAQFDFPILKTDTQLSREREELISEVVPYFRYDASTGYRAQRALNAMDFGEYEYVKKQLGDRLAAIYEKGVLPDFSISRDSTFSSNEIYVLKDGKAVRMPTDVVYGIESAGKELRRFLSEKLRGVNIDSLYLALPIGSLIEPDLIIDRKMTDDMFRAGLENLSTTQGLFKAGQAIVEYGDIVTAETQQILDSYKAEYYTSVGYEDSSAYLWAGNVIIVLSLVFVLFLAIYYCNYRIFDQMKKYLYLLLMFFMAFVAASFASGRDASLFYIIPFNLIALYLLAFFKKRIVFIVYIISLIPVLLFSSSGVELFVMYVVSGAVGMFVFERFNRGWLQFVTAFIVYVVMALVWSAFRIVEGVESLHNYSVLIDMALGALLMVAAYPLIYLFEKIFRLLSKSKLIDLSDTSNKLLRMLADKAPGTFQHSLQVMNLADAAARSIDADVPLVRAAALYHDIGKISNPQCFTENQTPGVNFHEGLTLKESAQEIIRHVSDGVALADKYGLPHMLKDFIVTHHGTTSTGYFYNKYLNEGGNPDDVSEFFYNGEKPTTKEQVIIMFCDAIEAASRSLKDYSRQSVSDLVDKIIHGKMNEGQLSDADISLKEISTLSEVIKSYLLQMHHSRVAYPKRKGGK